MRFLCHASAQRAPELRPFLRLTFVDFCPETRCGRIVGKPSSHSGRIVGNPYLKGLGKGCPLERSRPAADASREVHVAVFA
jgi:hypothetical protein